MYVRYEDGCVERRTAGVGGTDLPTADRPQQSGDLRLDRITRGKMRRPAVERQPFDEPTFAPCGHQHARRSQRRRCLA
jgi:hypothetical protein